MNKRVNYMQLLKESVADAHTADHDTSGAVDVKGPFLDPILGYNGSGELKTFTDAASILERYYFKNNSDPGVRVNREDAEIPQVGGDKGALPDEPEEVEDSMDDLEDYVMMDESDAVENAVIERLIAEMEGDGGEIGGPEPDQDPAAEFHEPSGDPDDENWEDLITGDAHDKEPPAAKIEPSQMKEDLSLFDLLEDEDITPGDKDVPESDSDTDDDDKTADDDLDVDKEVKSESRLGPIGNPHDQELEESFNIFSESFLTEDDDEDDDKDDDEDDDKDDDKDEDKDDDKDAPNLDEHDLMI